MLQMEDTVFGLLHFFGESFWASGSGIVKWFLKVRIFSKIHN